MRIKVSPPELDVEPELVGGDSAVVVVSSVRQERRSRDVPLVGGEKENVTRRRIHFVRFSGVDRFLLHGFDLEGFEFLVED